MYTANPGTNENEFLFYFTRNFFYYYFSPSKNIKPLRCKELEWKKLRKDYKRTGFRNKYDGWRCIKIFEDRIVDRKAKSQWRVTQARSARETFRIELRLHLSISGVK